MPFTAMASVKIAPGVSFMCRGVSFCDRADDTEVTRSTVKRGLIERAALVVVAVQLPEHTFLTLGFHLREYGVSIPLDLGRERL